MEAPYKCGLREWPELNEGAVFNDKAQGPVRSLLDFYTTAHPSSASRAGWEQRIRRGQVAVNGTAITDPAFMIPPKSQLQYTRLPWAEPPAPCTFQVLYEDPDLLVVNKPSGLQVVRGGSFHQRTLLTLLELLGYRSEGNIDPLETRPLRNEDSNLKVSGMPAVDVPGQRAEADRVKVQGRFLELSLRHGRGPGEGSKAPGHATPVHRLGRGTSGIVVCAKSALARAKLSLDFAKDAANASGTGSSGKKTRNGHGIQQQVYQGQKGLQHQKDQQAQRDQQHNQHRQQGQHGQQDQHGQQGQHCQQDSQSQQGKQSQQGQQEEQKRIRQSDLRAEVQGTLQKTYRALLQGILEQDEVLVSQPIGRVPYPGVAGGLYMASPVGKPAVSRIRVLGRNEETNVTLVEVDLYTGRAHQIRIHTACLGHPLVGEPLYIAGGIPSALADSASDHMHNSSGAPGPLGSDGNRWHGGKMEMKPHKDLESQHKQTKADLCSIVEATEDRGRQTPDTAEGSGVRRSNESNEDRVNRVADDGGHMRADNPLPGDCGYVLHAFRICFEHPRTNERLSIIAPPDALLQTSEELASCTFGKHP